MSQHVCVLSDRLEKRWDPPGPTWREGGGICALLLNPGSEQHLLSELCTNMKRKYFFSFKVKNLETVGGSCPPRVVDSPPKITRHEDGRPFSP